MKISTGAQSMSQWRWIGAPALISAGLVILFSAPLRIVHMRLPEPVFPLALAFVWPLIRPSLFAVLATFALGMFLDVYWDTPLGLWTTCLLMAHMGTLLSRSYIVGRGERFTAALFAAAVTVIMIFAYLFTFLKSHEAPTLFGLLYQTLATLALTPFMLRFLEQHADMDLRFR